MLFPLEDSVLQQMLVEAFTGNDKHNRDEAVSAIACLLKLFASEERLRLPAADSLILDHTLLYYAENQQVPLAVLHSIPVFPDDLKNPGIRHRLKSRLYSTQPFMPKEAEPCPIASSPLSS
jgi:hypothetical protein